MMTAATMAAAVVMRGAVEFGKRGDGHARRGDHGKRGRAVGFARATVPATGGSAVMMMTAAATMAAPRWSKCRRRRPAAVMMMMTATATMASAAVE